MSLYQAYLKLDDLSGVDPTSLDQDGYKLINCEFSFNQGIDDTGKASTEVFGGTLSLKLSEFPSNEIIGWALNSRKYKSGMIVTIDNNGYPKDKIYFENTACIGMTMDYTQKGRLYTTTNLVLQAEEIRFGSNSNIYFSNNWCNN